MYIYIYIYIGSCILLSVDIVNPYTVLYYTHYGSNVCQAWDYYTAIVLLGLITE